ncbi:thermonuclease family protein [Natronosalvus rutilus]|uniref:Thermonuclease family protein n=1 Tax=Natronosalvus rutilus TaxID=2953753 RepID=A0A9E7NB33_9EURY|nr:thermonuclease family protein [Natronosalvus rutilus]UTF55022.1 thermonuclease family protein [Natronosalvus rutilus]
MKRRTFIKTVTSTIAGLAAAQPAQAADSALDCGVWYNAKITRVVDGDTFDVYVYETGEEYNVRTLGHDTPEKTGNTSYEKIEEWEFIEDEAHLEHWGNEATNFAETELPAGSTCQVQVDCASEEIDQFGRLLAKIRYDRNGDGTDTVYNKLTLEEGYARVYAASLTNTDEYLEAQEAARAAGRGLWVADDGHVSEWRNDDVAATFHPHTSSVRTTDGPVPDSRVPVWTEDTAVQENTTASTVGYDAIPMVGVDESRNLAYFGGCTINERWEGESADLNHFTFVTNLIDHLHGSDEPSGPVLVDGGHRTFEQDNAVSAEDTAYYQRHLEGLGIELHSINGYGNGYGYSLSEARALVASCSPEAWSDAEITEVQNFVDEGGVVLLMGSGSETAGERANLDDLAAGLGSDLRLNYDDVRDDANYAGDSRKLLKTSQLNTADFDLWSAYESGKNVRTNVLRASPNDPHIVSTHAWTLADPADEFTGEVDTITVDYPGGTSLDGLTNDDVTVSMDRDGDGTVDEIPVNSDEYAGSAATFDLDGRYNTSVEGEVRVEIAGVENPESGEYVSTETLEGDDNLSIDAEYNVTDLTVATDAATRVGDASATLNGTLEDLDGADWGEVSFEWGRAGDLVNITKARLLEDTGSFSEDVDGLEAGAEYEYRAVVESNHGYTAYGSVRAFTAETDVRSDVIEADPATAGTESYHTWTLADPSVDFDGEVDTITVDYPDGTSVDGLTNDDVTVYMDRDGDGTVDEIAVNSDEYAGSAATFDLNGVYNTSVEGEVRVEIDGVTNPVSGEYVANETLEGEDFHSVDAEFIVD